LTSGLLGLFTFTAKLNWGDSVFIEFFDATLYALNGDEDAFTSPSTNLKAGIYKIKPQTSVLLDSKCNKNSQRFFTQVSFRGMHKSVSFFYSGPEKGNGTIAIYDLLGKEIKEISFAYNKEKDELKPALIGHWNLRNSFNEPVSSGCYLIVCSIGNSFFVDKIKIDRN
jgi:hypothetical protein